MSSSEENARIPSDHKTEGQAATSHEATSYEEMKRTVEDGQKIGQRRTAAGRCEETDGGPIVGAACCVL